jgi:hypothetical protein
MLLRPVAYGVLECVCGHGSVQLNAGAALVLRMQNTVLTPTARPIFFCYRYSTVRERRIRIARLRGPERRR